MYVFHISKIGAFNAALIHIKLQHEKTIFHLKAQLKVINSAFSVIATFWHCLCLEIDLHFSVTNAEGYE